MRGTRTTSFVMLFSALAATPLFAQSVRIGNTTVSLMDLVTETGPIVQTEWNLAVVNLRLRDIRTGQMMNMYPIALNGSGYGVAEAVPYTPTGSVQP